MSIRRRLCTLIAIATVAAAVVAGAFTAHAQMQWNPPCNSVRVINLGPCSVQLNLVTTPAGFIPTINVPPNGTVQIPVFGGPYTVDGILSLSNIFYPFIATLAPPPPPIPGSAIWWISHVTLLGNPPPGCCYDLFADPRNCTIWLRPSPTPPVCNP